MAKNPISADIEKMSFEQALAELEAIVGGLESGSGKLDEAIGAYERGTVLKKHCEAKLKDAKARIDKINIGADGVPEIEPADIE